MKKAIIGGAVALAIGTLAGAGSASAAPNFTLLVAMGKTACGDGEIAVDGPRFSGTRNPGQLPLQIRSDCGSLVGQMNVDIYRFVEPAP